MAEHAYPWEMQPHPSWIFQTAAGVPVVPGHRSHVDRNTNVLMVTVFDAKEEALLSAPKQAAGE